MTALLNLYPHFSFPSKTPKPKPKFSVHSHSDPIDDLDIPSSDVKVVAKFKSRHNYIRVLEVSRGADHPFAGSRLLLLDSPGNIHSIFFPHSHSHSHSHTLSTSTYFDVFSTFPPTLPPGPLALLGLGAASSAHSLLHLHPSLSLHAWEIDPAVLSVAREFFSLAHLERQFRHRLSVHAGDALAGVAAAGEGAFAGVLVDLFSKGSVVRELQEEGAWRMVRRCLRKGGRVMVNVGGSCVEAEEEGRDGGVVMEDTLEAMSRVFGEEEGLLVLRMGDDDSVLAMTGRLPDREDWRRRLPRSLAAYVDMWRPWSG